ncbi:unnamed protein product [Brassica oleracea]|uniref:Uncharacterized protein n=1 Tax=Brassica oleracea var. oleracea TaxID=109376 RepID=A0A0D3AJ07_BRAOL
MAPTKEEEIKLRESQVSKELFPDTRGNRHYTIMIKFSLTNKEPKRGDKLDPITQRRRPQNAIANIQESHGQDSSYFLGWEEYEKNPYDEIKNPNGMIQMGLVENQLCFDLIESWLAKNPVAAMAEFMEEIRGNRVTFDPKKDCFSCLFDICHNKSHVID